MSARPDICSVCGKAVADGQPFNRVSISVDGDRGTFTTQKTVMHAGACYAEFKQVVSAYGLHI